MASSKKQSKPLEPGDVIELRSGGPAMVVEKVTGDDKLVSCKMMHGGVKPAVASFLIPEVVLQRVSSRHTEIALSVLAAFKDNSAYEDYQREDGWTDAEYEDMLEFLRNKD